MSNQIYAYGKLCTLFYNATKTYAPEKEVIQKYDINDYKEKTELTDIKLYTTMISALRSYKDLKALDRSKKGLEKIIQATRNIYEKNSLKLFASGVLSQIISILKQ